MDLDSHLCYTTFIPLNISRDYKSISFSYLQLLVSVSLCSEHKKFKITSFHPSHEQTLLLQHLEVFSTLDSVVLSSQSQHMHSTTACSCWVTP